MRFSIVATFFTVSSGLLPYKTLGSNESERSSLRSEKQDVVDTIYTQAALDDRILSLPGLDFEPNFNQFSGYLKISEETNKSIFYWYVESQSNPETDPVVYWTNGGPGCSGLLAFGLEHGPFYYSSNETLTPNPYSWNKVANMFYVEQPAGVGFSFSDDKSEYKTGDAQAASDNYLSIKKFFEKFPERKQNDFYITSESFGGHYMPELANEIMDKNVDGSIKFKGFALGNPYVDPFSNGATMYQAFYSHGLISDLVYRPWERLCTSRETFDLFCEVLENHMINELEPGINPYALDYPVCTDRLGNVKQSTQRQQSYRLMQHKREFGATLDDINTVSPYSSGTEETSRRLDKFADYEPCEDEYFTKYLNRKDVQKAIHAREDSPKWETCSSVVEYNLDDRFKSLIDFYKIVMKRGLENDLNMMIYSGDDDAICSLAGTQYWIYDLGIDVKKDRLWKHWSDKDGQVAGYVTAFETLGGEGNFTLVTVHGAGHEVPSYKPEQALEMFTTFLQRGW